MRWWALMIVAAAAGCFKPTYESGKFQCSPKGECPSGFSCVASVCYAAGDGVDLASGAADLTGPADLAPIFDLTQFDLVPPVINVAPAAVWNSSGGGAAAAPSGAKIGLSVGGSVVGSATVQGSGNATLTFGKLGTAR